MRRVYMKRSETEINILKAFHGDSILVKTFDSNDDEFIILIDGGTASTFDYSLKKALKQIKHINIIVLTHIDSDHIAGLIKLFKSSLIENIQIDEIWMNNPELVDINSGELISFGQGDNLMQLIKEIKPNTRLRGISTSVDDINERGVLFRILSPSKGIIENLYDKWEGWRKTQKENECGKSTEISQSFPNYCDSLKKLNGIPFKESNSIDNDFVNASSISFILKCPDKSVLFLADSRAEIIYDSLIDLGFSNSKPLKVDIVKISHHGSKNNTSQDLLSLIYCNEYVITTNGGSAKHIHPSRETIARIVYNKNRTDEKLNIHFNYSIESIKDRIGEFINDDDLNEGNWNVQNTNKL